MSEAKEVLVDQELKEIIVRTLENTGALQNIRAQLRAATYLALEGQQTFPVSSAKIRSIPQTETGRLAVQLVRDFLVQAQLSQTLSVYDGEAGLPLASRNEDRLSAGIALNLPPDPEKPLLVQIVEIYQNLLSDQQRPKTAGRRIKSPLQSSAGDGDVLDP